MCLPTFSFAGARAIPGKSVNWGVENNIFFFFFFLGGGGGGGRGYTKKFKLKGTTKGQKATFNPHHKEFNLKLTSTPIDTFSLNSHTHLDS